MIFILLYWATIAAMFSGIESAQNIAVFLSMSLYFAGVLIWACILITVALDQWGKTPPKNRPIRSKITRISLLCVVGTLASFGWYWSAAAWVWWWVSIEAFSLVIREHWKTVSEKATP